MTMVATIGLIVVAFGQPNAPAKWQTIHTPPPMPSPVNSGYAPVNGIQMYYAVYGKGDPILMIPIVEAAGTMFSAEIPLLAKHHTVIIADSRGHGRSTRTHQPYSYALMAPDYFELLDLQTKKKVTL